MNSNPLIFGKNDLKRIVSMEDNRDGTMELFIQRTDGVTITQTVLNDYWILTDKPADQMSMELEGNGHFKYKNLFSLREDFEFAKQHFRKHHTKNSYFVNDMKEAFMLQSGYTYYKGLKHQEVSVLSFDIETTTLDHNKDSKILIISNTFRDCFGNRERKLFCYDEYESEKAMLLAWFDYVNDRDPSIICGHNIFNFDLGYINFCCSRARIKFSIGRKETDVKFNKYTSKFRKDGSQFIDYHKCYVYGREIVDTFFLSIKYDIGRKYESYGLKSIIAHEGLEVKNRQHYDANLIRKNYTSPEEWRKIKAYAEFDADDSLALWDLMGASTFYWCQSVPKPLQEIVCGATGSQINSIMIRSYFQENWSLPQASEILHYSGGISIGIPGIYSQTMKIDLLSAYPSTILVYKIYNKEKDPKANFLKIVEYFFNQRKEYKKTAKETGDQYFKDMDLMTKQAINSMYGTLGTNGLLFNYSEGASLITEKCRGYIQMAVKWATGKDLIFWETLNNERIE